MNKLVVSIEFTNNHNRILRISLESKFKKKLSCCLGTDDMICYLLFPEVSFRCIDKWRKARSCRGADDSYSTDNFLNHFPDLPVFFASCSCWVCVWNWWVAEACGSWSLRLCALCPVQWSPASTASCRDALQECATPGFAPWSPCQCCTKSFQEGRQLPSQACFLSVVGFSLFLALHFKRKNTCRQLCLYFNGSKGYQLTPWECKI